MVPSSEIEIDKLGRAQSSSVLIVVLQGIKDCLHGRKEVLSVNPNNLMESFQIMRRFFGYILYASNS